MDSVPPGTHVARCLLAPVWCAQQLGRVSVTISATTKTTLQQGNVMVLANHPSLIETFVIRYVLEMLTERPVWSIADEYLFPAKWFDGFQCMAVSRASNRRAQRVNVRALRQQKQLLTQQGVVVCYPEGTRTCKAPKRVRLGGREVGQCQSGIIEQAQKCSARLIPVWVDHGCCSQPESFLTGYRKLFFGPRITLSFGELYTGPVTATGIAEALLTVGQ